jgi:hypothetical protein
LNLGCNSDSRQPQHPITTNMDFVKDVIPYVYRHKNEVYVTIRPVSTDDAVLYMSKMSGEILPLSKRIEIFSFETGDYLNIPKNQECFTLSMDQSYAIRFDEELILSSMRDEPLGDRFVFPLSIEEQRAMNFNAFTILQNGDIEKDSYAIKVDSTDGIEVSRYVEGTGIYEDAYITEIDHDQNYITLNVPCLETLNRTAIRILG